MSLLSSHREEREQSDSAEWVTDGRRNGTLWQEGQSVRKPGCCCVLLRAEDGVFAGLGHAEFDDLLGGDLDGLALVGSELHGHFTGRAINQHELAETGKGEAVLGVLVGQFSD